MKIYHYQNRDDSNINSVHMNSGIRKMDKTESQLLRLIILQINNNTYEAEIQGHVNSTQVRLIQVPPQEYDGRGALYYVVIVLRIYAFSIILMIGSSIKKSQDDMSISKYMKGMDKLRNIEKRQQKFKARVLFHQLESRNGERSFRDSGNVIQEEEGAAVIAGENSNCDAVEDRTNDTNASSLSNEVNLNQQSYLSKPSSETVVELTDFTSYAMDVKTATGTHHTPNSAYENESTNVIIEECGVIHCNVCLRCNQFYFGYQRV